MTPKWRLIARRTAIIIAFAALLVATGVYIVKREFNLFVQIGLGIFIIGLAVYVALDPGSIRKALAGRQARHGSNALILGIAFLVFLLLLITWYLKIISNGT
jgi:hypothetical protein